MIFRVWRLKRMEFESPTDIEMIGDREFDPEWL